MNEPFLFQSEAVDQLKRELAKTRPVVVKKSVAIQVSLKVARIKLSNFNNYQIIRLHRESFLVCFGLILV